MPPDDVPLPHSAKSDQTPLFGGVVLAAILTLAIVGQTTGLLSVLRHSSQIGAKEAEAKSLQDRIGQLNEATKSAGEAASVAEKKAGESKGRMAQLQIEEQPLQVKVDTLLESKLKTERDLDVIRSKTNTLQAETAKLTGLRDSLVSETKNLESTRQSATTEISRLEGQKNTSLKELTDAARKLAGLAQEIAQAQHTRDELAVLTARTEDLKRENGTLFTQSQSLKKQVEKLQITLGDEQARLVAVTGDIKAATSERAELDRIRAQRDTLTADLLRFSAEQTTASASLKVLQSTLATIKADLADANGKLADARRALASDTAQLAATQEQKRTLGSNLEDLRSEYKRLAGVVEATKDSLGPLQTKLAMFQTTAAQEVPNTEALAKLHAALRLQVENLNQELRALNEAAKQIKATREIIQPAKP